MIEGQLQNPEGKGPARKVYHVTPKSLQAQLEGTLEALSSPQGGSVQFLLGLSNFPIVPRDQVIEALRTYIQKTEDRITHMLGRAEAQRPLPPFVDAMFTYSQALAEAELNWMKNFLKEVEAGNV